MFHVIFVEKENKELLEQYLGDYATWMPYGFGGKGMLGLYPTNEHSEEEIMEELRKHKIPYYTEVSEAVVLFESGNDSAEEAYKGIFIDRKTGDFKILTGRFPDKKAMINKYGTLGKDYIARKVFEKPVFDWILNNAKSSLDSYLMFSTAFSKWKDNSILDKYYMKLINDMPQLFKNVRAQDKIGGANKSKNADKESVGLEETYSPKKGEPKKQKIYVKTYDKDDNVLTDFGNNSYNVIEYYPEVKGDLYNNIDLWQLLRKMVKRSEELTGQQVDYVTVDDRPDDSMYKHTLMAPTREDIFDEHDEDAGFIHGDEKAYEDPTAVLMNFDIYCRDEDGKKIKWDLYPIIPINIEKKDSEDEVAIIDNYPVWHTAVEVLNAAGQTSPDDRVYVINPITGKEMWANRRAAVTNKHNMSPKRNHDEDFWKTNPKDGGEGKIKHSTWAKVRAKDRDVYNSKRFGNAELADIQRLLHNDDRSNVNRRSFAKMTRDYAANQINNNESVEMSHENILHEEIKKLIEAYGVYDLPDVSSNLDDMLDKKDTVRLYVKNDLGKEDSEVVFADTEDERCIDDIVAAANKLKSRNKGKKIFYKINDDMEQEYGF